MPNLLIIGDLHIGRLETMFANKWQTWSLLPVKQAIAYAVANNIKHIIQVGDVFDTPTPSQELLLLLIDLLEDTQTKYPQIIFYFLLGNHDKLDKKRNSLMLLAYLSKKRKLSNYRIHTKAHRCMIDKVPVVFLPWPLHNSNKLKKPALVIGHVERKGAKYDSGKTITENEFDLGEHQWIMGHLHEPQIFKNLIFVGGVLQWRANDGRNKFLWHLKFKPGNHKPSSYIKIPIELPYTLNTVTVNSLAENEWLRKIEHLGKNAYLKLMVHKSVVIPNEYLQHPRITVDYFGSKIYKQKDGSGIENVDNTARSRRLALSRYLKQYGLKKSRRKLALSMSDKIENSIDSRSN